MDKAGKVKGKIFRRTPAITSDNIYYVNLRKALFQSAPKIAKEPQKYLDEATPLFNSIPIL
jgi:hypothetical protein